MNFASILKKTTIVFFVLCFIVSINYVEANRTIRVKKIRKITAPRHISLAAGSSRGIYARKYDYGRPIPNFSTISRLIPLGRNRRYFGPRRNGKRSTNPRNYASGFRNWTPNRLPPGSRNNPRIDHGKKRPVMKRNPPFLEPYYGPGKQNEKRRIRPQRGGLRPIPPKNLNEYDEEYYYYPDEATREETKYEFESRYPRPKKKRRNPETNKSEYSKIPYYDEKPFPQKTKHRDAPVSYSTFIQHPSSEEQEDYYNNENSEYSQPIVRSKKKRIKKKSHSRKKMKEQELYTSYNFEKEQNYDEYDQSFKSSHKTTKRKPSYEIIKDENYSSSKPVVFPKQSRPQSSTIFSTSDTEKKPYDYKQVFESLNYNNPVYSQQWPQTDTTSRPSVQYKTENGFTPQQYIPSQLNYQNRDYSSVQTVKANPTYSQPVSSFRNVAYGSTFGSSSISTNSDNTVSNFNPYLNSVYNSQTSSSSSQSYQQPASSGSSYNNAFTIQKSVPVYDNTETFYNFNNNAYINSQSSKYYETNSDTAQKYNSRLSSGYRNNAEKQDRDSEFIKKHQTLYNNGLSGVPVQGDGFGKDSAKKDYDIGYGDFQFDENTPS